MLVLVIQQCSMFLGIIYDNVKYNKIIEDFRHRDFRKFTGEYCKTLRCLLANTSIYQYRHKKFNGGILTSYKPTCCITAKNI